MRSLVRDSGEEHVPVSVGLIQQSALTAVALLTAARKQQQEKLGKEILPPSPSPSTSPDPEAHRLRKEEYERNITSPLTRMADPVKFSFLGFCWGRIRANMKACSSSSAMESWSNISPTVTSITHPLLVLERRKCLRLRRSRLLLMLRRTCECLILDSRPHEEGRWANI